MSASQRWLRQKEKCAEDSFKRMYAGIMASEARLRCATEIVAHYQVCDGTLQPKRRIVPWLVRVDPLRDVEYFGFFDLKCDKCHEEYFTPMERPRVCGACGRRHRRATFEFVFLAAQDVGGAEQTHERIESTD